MRTSAYPFRAQGDDDVPTDHDLRHLPDGTRCDSSGSCADTAWPSRGGCQHHPFPRTSVHPAGLSAVPAAVAPSASIPVSPSALPADLPVPDVGVLAPPITAAVEMNTGTRIGEDASTTRSSPGYPYEAQDIEGQDALASEANAPSAHAALNISLANVPDHEAVLALLKARGATSTQLF